MKNKFVKLTIIISIALILTIGFVSYVNASYLEFFSIRKILNQKFLSNETISILVSIIVKTIKIEDNVLIIAHIFFLSSIYAPHPFPLYFFTVACISLFHIINASSLTSA